MYKTFKLIFAFAAAILFLNSNAIAGAYKGPDLSGEKIVISGPWLAPQDEQFRKVIKAFTDATGATVEYGGSLHQVKRNFQPTVGDKIKVQFRIN